jgi:hypothetical protein
MQPASPGGGTPGDPDVVSVRANLAGGDTRRSHEREVVTPTPGFPGPRKI